MLLFVCHNRKDKVSPPSTFLTVMTKDETVQLLSCDLASTCADESFRSSSTDTHCVQTSFS